MPIRNQFQATLHHWTNVHVGLQKKVVEKKIFIQRQVLLDFESLVRHASDRFCDGGVVDGGGSVPAETGVLFDLLSRKRLLRCNVRWT